VDDGRVGLNGRVGLRLTTLVGTMVCAYIFGAIALISLQSQDVVLADLIAAIRR